MIKFDSFNDIKLWYEKFDFSNVESFSLLLFDIDRLKHFNMTNGYQKGDECLEVLAKLIKEHFIFEHCKIGRISGIKYFCVYIFNHKHENLILNAENILSLFYENKFPLDLSNQNEISKVMKSEIFLTLSAGLITIIGNSKENIRLLQEMVIYELNIAKLTGRNKITSSIINLNIPYDSNKELIDNKITRDDAEDIIDYFVKDKIRGDCSVKRDLTIEKDFGWAIFYDVDEKEGSLFGNSPFIVTRKGEIFITGTSLPIDFYLEKFENYFLNRKKDLSYKLRTKWLSLFHNTEIKKIGYIENRRIIYSES